MKITDVQVYYIRQTQVKEQCDSGQDALIVKVLTDSGTYGIGEVDSSPLAVKGAIERAQEQKIVMDTHDAFFMQRRLRSRMGKL